MKIFIRQPCKQSDKPECKQTVPRILRAIRTEKEREKKLKNYKNNENENEQLAGTLILHSFVKPIALNWIKFTNPIKFFANRENFTYTHTMNSFAWH